MAKTSIGTAWIQIKPTTTGIRSQVERELNSELAPVADQSGAESGRQYGTSFVSTLKSVIGAAAIGKFLSDATSVGMDFGAQMSQVAATLGFSADELNDKYSDQAKTIEKLSEFSQELGRTTKFTARQSADALNTLALAGYNAEESVALLPKVLQLAAAGNLDLESAADVVVVGQKALGLTTEETANLIDQMAVTATKSNTSVGMLGEAIQTVGGNAKFLAGGTKELSALLAVLADAGYDGAEGGTKLRNVLIRLAAPTKAGAELMEQLGVSAYDSEGNLKSLPGLFGELSAAMAGFNDEQKMTAFDTMFNVRDLAAINALLDTTETRWDELSTAIENSQDAAEKMAGVQMDNLKGDITLLQSAFESFQIAVEKTIEPLARPLIDALTAVFSFIADHQIVLNVLVGLIAAVAGALLSGLVPAIWATTTALLANPITWIIIGIGLIIAGIITLIQNIDTVKQWFEKLGDTVIEIVGNVVDWFSKIPEKFRGFLDAIKNFFADFWNQLVAKVSQIATFIGDTVSGIFKAAINAVLGFIERFINTPIKLINKFIGLINKAFGAIGVNIGLVGEIKLPRLASGGVVGGVGTETSDSNVVALSKGEYVIRAAAAKRIGYDNLDRMNQTGIAPSNTIQNYFTINGYNKSPEELATIISRKIALRTQGVY